MARPKSKAPNRRYHMSGQSVVTIAGRDIYLGPHDSPESIARYAVLMQKLLLTLVLTVALFSIGCETQMVSKPPLPAPRSTEVEEANARLFNLLWSNTETVNWTNEILREELPPWQADFLLASMYAMFGRFTWSAEPEAEE